MEWLKKFQLKVLGTITHGIFEPNLQIYSHLMDIIGRIFYSYFKIFL